MAFELFDVDLHRSRGGTFVSVIGNGFNFTVGLAQQLELNKYSWVRLYYDTETKRIGLQFSLERLRCSCRILRTKENVSIHCKDFLRQHQIEQGRYNAEQQEDGMVVCTYFGPLKSKRRKPERPSRKAA